MGCELCKFRWSWQGCRTPWWRRRQDHHRHCLPFHWGNLKMKVKVLYFLVTMGEVFHAVPKAHLSQRWHDQPVVCHWAPGMSWPHEDHAHWTPQPPTQLDALCRSHVYTKRDKQGDTQHFKTFSMSSPCILSWPYIPWIICARMKSYDICKSSSMRSTKYFFQHFSRWNKVYIKNINKKTNISFYFYNFSGHNEAVPVQTVVFLTSGRNGWSGQVSFAVWTRGSHHMGMICSAANRIYEKVERDPKCLYFVVMDILWLDPSCCPDTVPLLPAPSVSCHSFIMNPIYIYVLVDDLGFCNENEARKVPVQVSSVYEHPCIQLIGRWDEQSNNNINDLLYRS